MRRLIALCASAALCVIAGLVLPAFADWSRVEIGGISVCKDSDTGATFKPPYNAKADVTKSCNVLTSFVPWLSTAEAATVLTRTLVNSDGSYSTAYPNDNKVPAATLAWDDACLAADLALIANQSTGTATDIDLAACKTGSSAGSATISLHTAVTGWSIGGSGSTHLLNAGSSAGSSATLGAIVLDLTAAGPLTDQSAAFQWAYQAPPSGDTLAPPVPTDIRTAPGTNQVVISGDTPWDACGNANCKGTKDIQLQLNGSGTLATVSVGPGFSCNPTKTNIGSMTTTPSATQSGNDWSIVSAGTMDGAADAYEFVNCAFSGAGFAVVKVTSFSGATGNFRKACIARRASQTAPGAVSIIGCAEIADSEFSGFFVDYRDTTDASRHHALPFVAKALPMCIKLEWTAADVHTFSVASVDGSGNCANDWTAQLSNYTLGFPATSYVGLGVTSTTGSSGTATTASLGQLNINNVARWSYTWSSSVAGSIGVRSRDKETTPNASSYSPAVTATPNASSSSAIKFQPGWFGGYPGVCRIWDGSRGCRLADLRALIASDVCPNANLVGFKMYVTPSFVMEDTQGNYAGGGAQGDRGFTVFDAVLSDLNACGKKLMLNVLYGWSGPTGNLIYYLPKFTIPTSALCAADPNKSGFDCSGGTDSSLTYDITCPTQYTPCIPAGVLVELWKNSWRDLAIAATQAYCARYDSDPAFYSIGMMFWSTSYGLAHGTYPVAAFYDNYVSWVAASRAACPTTNIDVLVDFTDSGVNRSGQDYIENAIKPYHAQLINNDTFPQSTQVNTWGQQIYLGMPLTGTTPTNDRGRIRYVAEIETPEMCSDKYGFNSPDTFVNFYQNGRGGADVPWLPSEIVVTMATNCNSSGTGWTAWQQKLAAIGGKVWNSRDATMRTPEDVRVNWCEDLMTCPP